MEQLTVDYSSEAKHLLINLTGNLILMDALQLKSELPGRVSGMDSVTVNIHGVNQIDLTGFNALLMTKKSLGDKPLRIKVAKEHEFHNLVHLTKFHDQFQVEAS